MIELLLCVAIWLAVALHPEVRRLAGRLHLGHRIFLGTLLGFMLLGQLADDGKHSFPFVPWNMYARRAVGDPFFHRYQLLRASGRREEVSGYGTDRPLSTQMHHRLQSLAGGGEYEVESANPSADLDATLRGIAQARALDVPHDPPVAIEIWRATVPIHDPRNPTEVRLEFVRRVELP